jgi:K+:H+ antiporter
VGTWNLLIEIVILLSGCLIMGTLFSRLKQSPLVGYLLAGMLLGGPGSLRIIQAESDIEAIAELGVSLLLFSLGLEFSWQRLKNLEAKTIYGGFYQVIFTAIYIILIALVFQQTLSEAIAIGCMVCLSSTACVLRILMDNGEIDSVYGRNSVAILLVQDLAIVPFAILMTLLAGQGSSSEMMMMVGELILLAALLIIVLYIALNKVAVKILGSLTMDRNRELSLLLAIVVGLGSTWLSHAAGLSPALGAFAAGMFLGSSPFATQIRSDISSLRVVLLTLFFGAVGMVADPIWIIRNWYLVLGASALIIISKTFIVWIIFKMMGKSSSIALATGLCLSQVGEFAFVLGTIGKEGGVVSEQTYMIIVSSAIVTLFLTPYLVSYAPRLGVWFESLSSKGFKAGTDEIRRSGEEPPEVIIIGFGPAGQAVGYALAESDRPVLILDLNEKAKQEAELLGFTGHIGDARQIEILLHANISSAKIIVITLPMRSAALTVLEHVRNLAPNAQVVVRSRYKRHRFEFEMAGAHAIFGDETEVGRSLSQHVMTQLG